MAKSTKPKFGSTRSSSRRDGVRRHLPKQAPSFWTQLQRPEHLSAALLLLGFIALSSALVIWSRDQIKVSPGQVMTDARLNRLDFQRVNRERTAAARDAARQKSPLVYTLDVDFLTSLRTPFRNLPVVVAAQTDFENIDPQIRDTYGLDAASLEALRVYVDEEGGPAREWTEWVDNLLDRQMVRHPIVRDDEWQRGMVLQEERDLPIVRGPDGIVVGKWDKAIPFGADPEKRAALRTDLAVAVRDAGFRRHVGPYVTAGLASGMRPTYVFNRAATDELAEQRAAQVADVVDEHRRGGIIYQRGDTLSDQQLSALKTEAEFYRRHAPTMELWLPRLGVFGLIAIMLAFAGGFALLWYPRLLRNSLRITAICLLMSGLLAITVVLTARVPELLYPVAIGATLFVVIVILLAYDQRLALFLGISQCALVTLAMDQGVGWFMLLMAGCGTMIGQLRRVRTRNSLIRASIVTAIALGVGTVLHGLFVSPAADGIWLQILGNAAWAIAASVVVGFLVLGILPSIEKLFDITTGMTLAELRDPSQPLLRQLQQRAPGTYNHSLQVANVCEAAAEAIGADSLLVYVGALYHDIGKMNKPEYFIENQSGGFNKHSKLRPAMSLLLIIGHVKDGIELGREYGLPRQIQHFIESHHGTTLVEYFYHAARTEAESDDKASVEEIEFRYPGPRPHTKEAAIMMLGDAVESATRAMTEPNPSRIESIVRELSRKRLLDGQFDECDLTFRELSLIEDAIIARLCAIHHGRISYPSSRAEAPTTAAAPERQVSA